ncbi:hypothetical protein [uncultured Desulfobacter sp.]|uniref:hypothetical protein n=1 Tax=uncultured Desulfobacter sp. TaxID=240139 RepID=UPI002AAC1AF9|nr:hypothetical protein [uncultured Desulfobacter sp.]
MLDGLQTEIAARSELAGASKKIIMAALNDPGSAETEAWVVSSAPVLVDKDDIYTYHISDATFVKLIDFLDSEAGRYMKARFDSANSFNLAATAVRTMLAGLYAAEICTEDEYKELLRLGEVQKSRAEELFGRFITAEDFES